MTAKKDKILIGNASGYWGDDPSALLRQLSHGRLDYVTMDFLAEVTMSIMQKQRAKNPELGYAKDLIVMLEEALPLLLKHGTRLITNAGGVNPSACAAAIKELATRLGLTPKIAVVYGDDILVDVDTLQQAGCSFENMETGESFGKIRPKLEAANIYFGAVPVVEALKWEPDIIITGRVTDTGITIAPMIHEFGWSLEDWDKLASGIVAGHILECGSQSTGGNFTDWHKVESFDNIGYPIAEVYPDGQFVITKHQNTGGLVSVDTVREQLVYEMGQANAYITPDVVADFTTIQLSQEGPHRVRVQGIKGYEPTSMYKVSMAYNDGYKSVGEIAISGPHARAKAEAFDKIFWERCGTDFQNTETEFFGWNACHRSLTHREEANEIILRLGVHDDDPQKLRRFGKLIPSLILSGPPGVCVLGGVPRIQDVVSYWPALIDKKLVTPKVALFDNGFKDVHEIVTTKTGHFSAQADSSKQVATSAGMSISAAVVSKTVAAGHVLIELEKLCLARSGDKGDTANIGVLARSEAIFNYLNQVLTAQQIKDWFQELCLGNVIRYKLNNLHGYNFLLEHALGGGGTKTLRTDAQGKTFAQALLKQKIMIPEALLGTIS